MISDEEAVIRPIVSILLLNVVIFSLQDACVEEIAYQYWAMRRKFRKCDVEAGSGPAYLVFAIGMTPDMKGWAEPEHMGLIARMMSIENRMSRESQEKLKSSVLGFISGSTMEDSVNWWCPADLHRQVFTELFVNV